MKDIIYREDAINILKKREDQIFPYNVETVAGALKGAQKLIGILPSAHRRGHWIADDDCLSDYCSECGEPCATYAMGKPRDRYCKWCGADMRGATDG